MKQPVWFPYRYSFLFSAVVILLAARVLTAGPQRRRALGAGRRADAGLAGGVSPAARGGAVQQDQADCRGGAVYVISDSGVAAD